MHEVMNKDIGWMELALEQAELAAKNNEVPVGAVLVRDNQLVSQGRNMPISTNDPTAHAEIVALREAALMSGNYRLSNATLYVTLEPCPMCVGAMLHARISRIVFGATDPKTGALISQYRMGSDGRANHMIEITEGILAEKCGKILKDFFARRRKNRKI